MTSALSRGARTPAFLTPALLSAALVAASLALSACDGGASAVRVSSNDGAAASGGGVAYTASSGVDHRKDPTPLLDGKPMWAANRLHGAEDNARYHFKRDGQAFGAGSMEDYVRTAQAFIAAPPAGSEVIKRANGDKLIYDPRGNVFAVATSEGAPRALFKPKDGQAYWEKQKAGGDRQNRAGRRQDSNASTGGSDPQG